MSEILQTRADSQNVLYREVALNPTNPDDLADEFETELIMRFRDEPGTRMISGFRDSKGERMFYNARPMAVTSETCLVCHSTPEAAPPGMVERYGTSHGFGWQLNEIVGTQIGYVPAAAVWAQGSRAWLSTMAIAIFSLALAILAINLLLRRSVIRPIGRMAALAQRISDNELTESEPESLADLARRGDELGQMARAFQRMAREVYAREQMLHQQVHELQIEMDEVKKARQVAEITSSDFFQDLQAKAKKLRGAYRLLRQELDAIPAVESVTLPDALALPEPARKAVSKAFQQGSLTSSELAAELGMSAFEARQIGETLVEKGYLMTSEPEADGKFVYRVNVASGSVQE